MVIQPNVPNVIVKDEFCERISLVFREFLLEFEESNPKKYIEALENLKNSENHTLIVSFSDIQQYNEVLSNFIHMEYLRILPYLCNTVKLVLKELFDVSEDKEVFISFIDYPTRYRIRELSSDKIGMLLRITGQVVRTHPVHPELVLGTFICSDCQTTTADITQQFKYTQPSICRNLVCQNRVKFLLDVNKSTFVDFQKIRIQETQAELPRGNIPWNLEVIVRGDIVEQAQAGDKCDFVGTLIVVPDVAALSLPGAKAESTSRGFRGDANQADGVTGLRSLGVRDLSYRLVFMACSVIPTDFGGSDICYDDLTPEDLRKMMTDAEWNKIYSMTQDRNLYSNLVASLFPTIHGNDEVKRGVLLMLFGGVRKKTKEGISLRGDINICIVGDPSTAKSQILKQVESFSSRVVYTSGKASTAAGLTAAVVKDEESHEFVIEAGALMLADNGICCIDEFDKMEHRDQIAIHEAMEQQTISISKAGINATLNARTSILAAANPVGGRYDRYKSLKANTNMTSPIMSRFDLFFVLIDECNEATDLSVATSIVNLHRGDDLAENFERIYSIEEIQRYMLFARQFKPSISKEAQNFIVSQYKTLRIRDANGTMKSAWKITVRQLESLIRLSEALARLHCHDEVQPKHVKEAYRLLSKSIIHIESPDIEFINDQDDAQKHLGNVMGIPTGVDSDNPGLFSPSDSTAMPTDAIHENQVKITSEEYRSITNMLIFHLRHVEEHSIVFDDFKGMPKSELISWYLNQIENEIDSEAHLQEKTFIVDKIINRLVDENIMLIIRPVTELTTDQPSTNDGDSYLLVHPNYVIDR